MDVQFGEHARHIDFSGQAADIGLFRIARSRTRRVTTTHDSALVADGHIGRGILSYTVRGAIALGLGALVSAVTSDVCLAASPVTNETPDTPSVIASAEPYSSAIDPGISLRPTPISPIQGTWRAAIPHGELEDQVIRKAQRHGFKPIFHTAQWTAVYDIAAHIVYMPNGERLEAHSGLGDMLDDPDKVHEKNRGPTPPNVYDLVLRDQLFHGVQALRLIPVGSGDVYGRDGFLAHSYMLGPQGFSNGCVVFKNYNKFLGGYFRGEVKRLIVVAHMNSTGRDGNSQRDGRQQVKVCTANVHHLDRHGPGQRHVVSVGCGAVYGGAHREALRSTQRAKGMGMMDARNKQPFRRPAKPAVKDS